MFEISIIPKISATRVNLCRSLKTRQYHLLSRQRMMQYLTHVISWCFLCPILSTTQHVNQPGRHRPHRFGQVADAMTQLFLASPAYSVLSFAQCRSRLWWLVLIWQCFSPRHLFCGYHDYRPAHWNYRSCRSWMLHGRLSSKSLPTTGHFLPQVG